MRKKKRKETRGGGAFGNAKTRPHFGLSNPLARARWEDVPQGKMCDVLEALSHEHRGGFLASHGDEYAWICFPDEADLPTIFSVNAAGEIERRLITQPIPPAPSDWQG
jgi:hypothetical protein